MSENVREEPAMSDIVERLLDQDSDWIYTERAKAAAEITRLRAELAEARHKAFKEATMEGVGG